MPMFMGIPRFPGFWVLDGLSTPGGSLFFLPAGNSFLGVLGVKIRGRCGGGKEKGQEGENKKRPADGCDGQHLRGVIKNKWAKWAHLSHGFGGLGNKAGESQKLYYKTFAAWVCTRRLKA